MQFNKIFTVLRKYLSDGYDVPSFFREFIQMITDVPESDWDTPKDPSGKCKDNTLKSYASRGLSKKFARSIVYRLDTYNLEDRLYKLPEQAATGLVEDFQRFDSSIGINNYSEKIADHVCNNIRASAGLISQDKIDENAIMEQSAKLKNMYGDALLRESQSHCSFPGCGKPLYKENNGKTQWVYEVTMIDKNKDSDVENLLAACPDCHATYLLDDDSKLMKKLLSAKNVLSKAILGDSAIGDIKIEQGLTTALEKIKKLNVKELEKATFNPEKIEDKIDTEKEPALYLLNRNLVTSYYLTVRNILRNFDKKGVLDYEELQEQMKGLYRKLRKRNISQMEIFEHITNKIQTTTKQETITCQIIVAYFVQNCEVFDAIPK
jgi:hypothetical protein